MPDAMKLAVAKSLVIPVNLVTLVTLVTLVSQVTQITQVTVVTAVDASTLAISGCDVSLASPCTNATQCAAGASCIDGQCRDVGVVERCERDDDCPLDYACAG